MLLRAFQELFSYLCDKRALHWLCEALGIVSSPKRLRHIESKPTSVIVYQGQETGTSSQLLALLGLWPWSTEGTISFFSLILLMAVWSLLIIRSQLQRTKCKLLQLGGVPIDYVDDYPETWQPGSAYRLEDGPEEGAGEIAQKKKLRTTELVADQTAQRILEESDDEEDTFSSETFNDPALTCHRCEVHNFATLFNVLKVVSIEELSSTLFLLRCVGENLRLKVISVEGKNLEEIERDLKIFQTLRTSHYCDHGLCRLPDIRHLFFLTDSLDKLIQPHLVVSNFPTERLLAIAWAHEDEVSIIRFLSENTCIKKMETLLDQLFVGIGSLKTISENEDIPLALLHVGVSLVPCDGTAADPQAGDRSSSVKPSGVWVKFNPHWLEAGILLQEVVVILDFYLKNLEHRSAEAVDTELEPPNDTGNFHQCQSLILALQESINTHK